MAVADGCDGDPVLGDGVTKYSLVPVLPDGPHPEDSEAIADARRWLADSVRDVPAELGVAVSLDAYGDVTISLHTSTAPTAWTSLG
ncbi:MAG: hypothetical protein M3O28_07870 [Actinomycetota bacterium]|nr:hypothetical protein [Actinomycetota bacterium]